MTYATHFIIAAIFICEVAAMTASTLEDIAKHLVLLFRRLILPSNGMER